MTTGTARLMAEALAQRLGVEASELEATIADNPMAAAVAFAMMTPPPDDNQSDAAATVRFVASMVGACPLCLGEDEQCDDCKGIGKPGSRQPNGDALLAWIARPLHRLGLCVSKPRREPDGHS